MATVVVSPAMATINSLGDTVRFTARGSTSRGRVVDDAQFTWTSSAASVASVGSTGLVTAVGNGATIISAASGGGTGVAGVTVAQKVATIAVSPATHSLNAVGATIQLGAVAKDATGHEIAGMAFTWSSSSQAVASVNASGLVTAVAGGSATITASAHGVIGTAAVSVSQLATSITVAPTSALLKALGATAQFAATPRDANSYPIAGKRITWTSSPTSVATVDTTGKVTAVANGSATITAAADGVTSTASIAVAQELTTVAITPASANLGTLGRSVQLAASGRDANGFVIAGKTFNWASAQPGIASVNSSGLVTAVTNGRATITAVTEGATGSCQVTVAQKAAAATLSPSGATLTGVGASRQFAVTAQDSGGSAIPPAGIHATWTSLIPGIATVSSTGLASAVGAGQVTIRMNLDGVVEYATLTVMTPGLPRVNLWARLESGFTDKIDGLWGTSATDVFAASSWRVLHFNGTAWSTATQFFGFLNMGAWGSSGQDVYVGGKAGNVLHYDGTLWSVVASGRCNMIASLWGASPRDIFGVCWDGAIVHYDGSSWTSMAGPPAIGLHRVWGTSRKDVYALGMYAAPGSEATLHYDGTSWNVMASGQSGALGLWGTSGADIYAAGVGGRTHHYDGIRWTTIVAEAPIQIWSIWGSSATDIYFAGADTAGRAAVLHYDGINTWRLAHGSSQDTLYAIWGSPTGEMFAAGAHGSIFRGYRNGTMGINPSVATVNGANNRVKLTALPGAGATLLSGVPITWSSFNPGVATVDEEGWVTGVSNGTAVISAVAFGGAAATASITVDLSKRPPVATIDSPSRDTTITRGEAVQFRGTASDADGTIVRHVWDFGDGSGATVEDPGAHTYTAVGTYRVTYRVVDNDSLSSPAAAITVNVAANQAPAVTITSPANGATFAPGASITFTGSAQDHEDGALTGAALVWTSSRDGQIGTGTTFTRNNLSLGSHTITLSATDTLGATGSSQVVIDVATVSPIAAGAWQGSTTGMALEFNVSADAGYVTQMKYTFSGLSCGGVTLTSGSVTKFTAPPGFEITNRQFTVPSSQDVPGVVGTFGANGTSVTGTWTWLTCSGAWSGSH